MVIDPLVEQWISEEELIAEALAADPEQLLGDDALPFNVAVGGDEEFSLLPAWYMPAAGRSPRRNLATVIVLLVVGALLLAEAFGICLTSGRFEIPL